MNTELIDIAGIAETHLTAEILAQLPDAAPAAPWRGSARLLSWWSRPDRDAIPAIRALLPPALRAATPVVTVGALVSYLDTPVGRYSEVIGGVLLRQGRAVSLHVPFIAVDSAASVVGGRANWALPKTLATFEGEPAGGAAMTASGPNWRITATTQTRGPALPVVLPPMGRLVQAGPRDTTWSVRLGVLRAKAQLARVTVEVAAEGDLATLLTSGSRTGLLCSPLALHLPAATIRPATA